MNAQRAFSPGPVVALPGEFGGRVRVACWPGFVAAPWEGFLARPGRGLAAGRAGLGRWGGLPVSAGACLGWRARQRAWRRDLDLEGRFLLP